MRGQASSGQCEVSGQSAGVDKEKGSSMSDGQGAGLLGGPKGPKGATFPSVGSVVVGTIVDHEWQQERVYTGTAELGVPRVYEDGNPILQLVVTIQTDDQDDADDDGLRRLFLKGSKTKATLLGAVTAACQAVGADLIAGGVLSVERIKDAAPVAGRQAAHEYTATYTPPEG